LRKLPVKKYAGGPVDLYVEGREGVDLPYRMLIRYRGAAKPAWVMLEPILVPDADPPKLSMVPPDTLIHEKGKVFQEPGIACSDAKDGAIPPVTSGTVNVDSLGTYDLLYSCRDKAGNAAKDAKRAVTVIPMLDRVAPRVVLNGSDFVGVLLEQKFIDSGAVCLDDRDVGLTVDRKGSINTSQIGIQKLLYSCSDRNGNQSPQVVRTVQVINRNAGDSAKPSLVFETGKTVEVGRGSAFADPVVVCIDGNDGNLEVTRAGTVDVQKLGEYPLFFSCTDRAGNRDTATLVVRVTQPNAIFAQQESSIDTLDVQRNPNHGFTGALKFTSYPADRYITLVKFDLAKASLPGLKSAYIRFRTFGTGSQWTSERISPKFRISRVKSSWVEGTGNWYWSEGGWKNGGEALFANYVLTDSIKAGSGNPLSSDGISSVDKAIARAENLEFLGSQEVGVAYSGLHGPGAIPAPANLVNVDLDVTGYLQSAEPALDFGILITVEGVPAGRSISFLTKEVGDGSFAPELILSY
jgi:hypothetical protein